jgi:hypothetical protein
MRRTFEKHNPYEPPQSTDRPLWQPQPAVEPPTLPGYVVTTGIAIAIVFTAALLVMLA